VQTRAFIQVFIIAILTSAIYIVRFYRVSSNIACALQDQRVAGSIPGHGRNVLYWTITVLGSELGVIISSVIIHGKRKIIIKKNY
jgi:hypothetical protein